MRLFAIFVAASALAACGANNPVADNVENGSGLPTTTKAVPSPTGGPPANRVASAPSASASSIPAALQGRWGLTPGDCTTTRGDEKGLLTVGANELRFYESRAVPAHGLQTSADSVSGDFSFTGEGQNWTKYEALQIQKGKLVRTERNPNASFTYARCE